MCSPLGEMPKGGLHILCDTTRIVVEYFSKISVVARKCATFSGFGATVERRTPFGRPERGEDYIISTNLQDHRHRWESEYKIQGL